MNNPSQNCAYCGSPLHPGSRFCEACGQPVGPAGPITPGPYSTVPPQQTPPAPPPPPVYTTSQTPPSYSPPAQPVYQTANIPPAPPQKKGLNAWWVCGIIAVVMLCIGIIAVTALVAFNLAGSSKPTIEVTRAAVLPEATKEPVQEATTSLPQPTAIPPTAVSPIVQPTPESTSTPTSPVYPQIVFGNVSFLLNPDIASSVESTRVPASPPSADMPPWEVYPEYIDFELDGYTLSDTFHQPAILVYPADEYRNMDDNAGDVIDSLKNYLATRPTQVSSDTDLPFLPFWNAAQVMASNIGYVEFKNGSGIRYLAQYGQDVSPVNNKSIFYTFQGLTKDGKYYIAAILPIQHPKLPASSDNPPGGWEEFQNNYLKYLSEAVNMLNQSKSTDFSPSLDSLDELIGSITIK